MKLTVVGPRFPDSFAENVVVTLENMGHNVQSLAGRSARHDQGRYQAAFLKMLPKVVPAVDGWMHSSLCDGIAEFQPDLVIVTYDFFSPDVVQRIKSAAGAPVVCWYIDAPANLRSGNLFLCGYDAFFLKEPRLVETMTEKLGMPAHYLPEACNPLWHRPVTPTADQMKRYACDITAQGTAHPYRAKFFEGLLDFEIKIWGTPPSPTLRSPAKKLFQGLYLASEEKAAAFASAKIVVNSMHFAEQQGVNNTLFEAAGCGSFQLCDDRPTLHEFFKDGEEVVTFRTRDELLQKVRYYLARDDERKKIAERASRRAHAEHTYQIRLASLLQTMRLGAS